MTGSLPLQAWRLEDLGASTLNWAVVVHPQSGFVYAANQNGVLEFDGVRWRLIPLPRGGPVRSVAVAPDGKVWAGGAGQICRLEPDAQGGWRAVDAGAQLPELAAGPGPEAPPAELAAEDGVEQPAPDRRRIGVAPQVVTGTDGVYFVLPGRVVRFRPDGGFDLWPKPAESNVPGWWSEGALLLVSGNQGIHRLGPEGFSVYANRGGPRVLASGAHPAGGWVWHTSTGPVRVVGRQRTPIAAAEVSALFRADRPRCALALADGSSAYGTINHGLVVVDAQGRLVQVLNRARGLPANRINGIAADREGGLWLAMHAGLVRVQVGTPLAMHGLAQGLSGSPWEIRRQGDRILVTHSEGAAWRDPADGRFYNFPTVTAAMHQLAARPDEVLAAGLGLYALRPDGSAAALTPNDYRYGVSFSRIQPDRFYLYGPQDVQVWQRPGAAAPWKPGGALNSGGLGADDLLEDSAGFLWLAGRDARVRRLDLRAGLRADAPVRVYGPAEGLPLSARTDKLRLLELNGDLLVTGRRGVWRHVAGTDRFEPEPRLAPGGAGPAAATATPTGAWLFYAEPEPRLVEVVAGDGQGGTMVEHPVPALGGTTVHSLFEDRAARTLWIASQGSLLSYRLDWQPGPPPPPLRATLRRVQTLAGEVLWSERATAAGPVAADLPALRLEPHQRALRVEFTTVAYQTDLRGRPPLRFRTRVEGVDAGWTGWTNEAYRDLTNLPDGRLAFELEARDLQGRESPVARMEIHVLPPWWRTPAARMSWVLLGLGAVSGVIALRTRALRRRSLELEAIVAARTEELRLQNVELERLHRLELDETAAARLAAQQARLAEEKAHLELLRYQLNPHFLLNAFTTLRGLVFSQPAAAGEMVGRLAAFCRLALTRSDEAGATVAEEAQLVETYLATEQARWRDSLHCSVTIAPGVGDRRLPPFLLQPLVENAVKYGGRTSPDLLHVRVAVDDDGAGGLRIEVANSGAWVEPGSAATDGESTRLGLENLRQRLRRYYPERHTFEIQSDSGWVKIRLHLRAPA